MCGVPMIPETSIHCFLRVSESLEELEMDSKTLSWNIIRALTPARMVLRRRILCPVPRRVKFGGHLAHSVSVMIASRIMPLDRRVKGPFGNKEVRLVGCSGEPIQ